MIIKETETWFKNENLFHEKINEWDEKLLQQLNLFSTLAKETYSDVTLVPEFLKFAKLIMKQLQDREQLINKAEKTFQIKIKEKKELDSVMFQMYFTEITESIEQKQDQKIKKLKWIRFDRRYYASKWIAGALSLILIGFIYYWM